MQILLTNDDSHRSPLLRYIIEILSGIGELTIVVPRDEQSWRGKSLTRFGSVHFEAIDLFDKQAYAVAGTPADCVNIGLHFLAKKPIDLVVSGINAGTNSGTSFIFSSGTVGACFEANIAGVPAVALSQQFASSWWRRYVEEYRLDDEVLLHLERQIKAVVPQFFFKLAGVQTFLKSERAVTLNLNIPERLREGWCFKSARLTPISYDKFFSFDGIKFECDGSISTKRLSGGLGMSAHNDTDILGDGNVPISVLDIHQFGALVAENENLLAPLL